jgi:hypothetical protein
VSSLDHSIVSFEKKKEKDPDDILYFVVEESALTDCALNFRLFLGGVFIVAR